MRLKLRVFGFLLTTHAKTHAKQMRPRSSPAVQHFTHVYLQARTAVDADDIRTWQTWRAPCQNKDGAGSGISSVYLRSSHKFENWIFLNSQHKPCISRTTEQPILGLFILIQNSLIQMHFVMIQIWQLWQLKLEFRFFFFFWKKF